MGAIAKLRDGFNSIFRMPDYVDEPDQPAYQRWLTVAKVGATALAADVIAAVPADFIAGFCGKEVQSVVGTAEGAVGAGGMALILAGVLGLANIERRYPEEVRR